MTDKNVDILMVEDEDEDRYSRLRLIPWWDQDLLREAKVLVIGAGALGNEILKNLALVGIGKIIVLDMDNIENSNLSRSVLFRAANEGRGKAEAAAAMIRQINPDCKVQWLQANAVTDLGLGVYRWADLVIGGLDNRLARLSINQSCWRVGKPWIDGAIEVLVGVARVFIPPDSACYECTMNELDFKLLPSRYKCPLIETEDMMQGKVPTTPTTASIIAGIQVQEALKLIHQREDLPSLKGRGYFFNGLNYDSYIIEYDRKKSCLSHDSYGEIADLDISLEKNTLEDLLKAIRAIVGQDAKLELERELVIKRDCNRCSTSEPFVRIIDKITKEDELCLTCEEEYYIETTHFINGEENYLDCKLKEIGIPGMEIVIALKGGERYYFELSGDKQAVLGVVE